MSTCDGAAFHSDCGASAELAKSITCFTLTAVNLTLNAAAQPSEAGERNALCRYEPSISKVSASFLSKCLKMTTFNTRPRVRLKPLLCDF